MKAGKISVIAATIIIGGCASIISNVSPLSVKEMVGYSDINELIEKKDISQFRYSYSDVVYGRLIEPITFANNFCEYQGGNLVKTENANTLRTPLSASGKSYSREEINQGFGLFECRINNEAEWDINISHINHRVENAHWQQVSVITTARNKEEIVLAKQQKMQDEINKEIMAKLAEQKRIEAQQKRAEAEKERVANAEKQIASFRNSIEVSSNTNCGPVLEVNRNLLKVYFPVQNYGNEHWISVDDIFPASYGCTFRNGQYQTPRI